MVTHVQEYNAKYHQHEEVKFSLNPGATLNEVINFTSKYLRSHFGYTKHKLN